MVLFFRAFVGGFDLAAQWCGWENVFQVEWDEYCQKVLAKNFPKTKRYGNIKEFDGTKYTGAVDVISGGFPCQPFSVAGNRTGTADNRYLWPEMLRICREVRPSIIVAENVPNIANMVLEGVCVSLEEEGYKVEPPFIIPACAFDAPHRRDRIWIIAYTSECEQNGWSSWAGWREWQPKKIISDVWRRKGEGDGMWKIESAGCGIDDGLSEGLDKSRSERLEGLGNAIVPQIAEVIFRAVGQILNCN